MRIVIAPDKFKGTLTAAQAAVAMSTGVALVRPDAEVFVLPIADGGEGTSDAFLAAGAQEMHAVVSGPLGGRVQASWAKLEHLAVIEAAQANGLIHVRPSPSSSLAATTYGVGELLASALDAGCTEIILAVGGSASTDAGAGMAQALGITFADADGLELPPGGGHLERLAVIDASRLDPRVRGVAVTVACDVESPLVGALGAAAVYGPQKGAGHREIGLLGRGLARFAEVVKAMPPGSLLGGPRLAGLSGVAGGGAAGGLAAGAIAFLGANLESGAELVLRSIFADDALENADLVITGEGSLDEQSLYGKGPGVLAAHARRAGADVIAVAGQVHLSAATLVEAGIVRAFSIIDVSKNMDEAVERSAELLTAQTATAVTWWLDQRNGQPS